MASSDDFTARIRAKLGLPAAGNGVQREAATGVLPIGPDETSSVAGSQIDGHGSPPIETAARGSASRPAAVAVDTIESTGAGDSRSSAPSLSAVPPPPALTNGHLEQARANIREGMIAHWQSILFDAGQEFIKDPVYQEQDNLVIRLAQLAGRMPETVTSMFPLHPDSAEYEGALTAVAVRLLNQLPAVRNKPLPLAISWEGHEAALAANEAYLARIPVIDKLCYSSAVSMITGGKHAGKSTLARWMAICVAKGLPFLGRAVTQGPVIYIASEDETMAARQELLRLGWGPNDPIHFLSASNAPTEDRVKLLEAIARDIKSHRVVFVVFDMLFDFVDIVDEMSYAGTRGPIGRIQAVASDTSAHLTVLHHAPKNAMIADPAVAALGSQGLAARVSPIILVRRFGPGVHSIVSTAVRDPRGEAIVESRLLRHEDGSVSLAGAWKVHMLAEAYSPRILDFITGEEGAEVTAVDVSNALMIPYEVSRACLSSLYKGGALNREGAGKKGKPFRYSAKNSDTPHIGGMWGISESDPESRAGLDEFFNLNKKG